MLYEVITDLPILRAVACILHRRGRWRLTHSGVLTETHKQTEPTGGVTMAWTKPSFNEMRFGFEVSMYVFNR